MRFNSSFLNMVFPPKCLLCSMPLNNASLTSEQNNNKLDDLELIICRYCQSALPELETTCSKCSIPLNTQSELCGVCLKEERHWQQCIAAFPYASPTSQLIHQFKHQNKTKLTDFFAHSILSVVSDELSISSPDFLVCVPMHPIRFAQRGYNQSYQLTRTLNSITDIPHANAFIKTKETPPQASLNKKERETILKNNFVIKKKLLPNLKNKYIVIIDDVMTTGATTSELARILKLAKATRVDVWCIART